MSKNVAHFTKIADDVHTSPLLEELHASPEMWLVDTNRQRKVRCQRHTQNIFLRAPKKPLPPGAKNANDVHESRLTRAAAKFPCALAICERIAVEQEGTLGRATLVTLLPKSRVFPHIDAGEYYRIRDRFHLVLKSPSGSPLTAGGETVVMRKGELWVFNNKVRHSAENPSDEPRVHLIFDVLPAPGRGYHVCPSHEAATTAQWMQPAVDPYRVQDRDEPCFCRGCNWRLQLRLRQRLGRQSRFQRPKDLYCRRERMRGRVDAHGIVVNFGA